MKAYYYILGTTVGIIGSMDAQVITLRTQEQFDTHITQSNKPAVVKFYADWCGPCQMAQEPFHTLAQQSDLSDITFAQVNADQASSLIDAYNITGLPTFLFFDAAGNQVLKKTGLLGATNGPEFSTVLKKTLTNLFTPTDQAKKLEPKSETQTIWSQIKKATNNLFEWIKRLFS